MSINPQPVCALVLAGRRASAPLDPVAASAGVPAKTFVPIGGRTMLERVVATLRSCPEIGEIHVSLPDNINLDHVCPRLAAEFASGTLHRVSPSQSPSASVREFVASRVASRPVLVTTGDHPLLTPEMVGQFLHAIADTPAEAAVALTDVARISGRYPGSRRTSLRFAEGGFTGCNLFAFRGAGALAVLAFWRRIDEHRKQPWQLARAIGLGTLLLYVTGRLRLERAIARLSRVSGCPLQAVILDDPHAGIDVDKLADLELVRSILEPGASGAGRR